MTIDQPTALAPETELMTAETPVKPMAGTTFRHTSCETELTTAETPVKPMAGTEGADDMPEIGMDGYPEYWIG